MLTPAHIAQLDTTPDRDFAINPRPVRDGGGFELVLLEDMRAVSSRIYPAHAPRDSQADRAAYRRAHKKAIDWLLS